MSYIKKSIDEESLIVLHKEEHQCEMIGNGDQLFSDSKLKMMSEIYEVNSWVEIFGCGRGRAVKGSISK